MKKNLSDKMSRALKMIGKGSRVQAGTTRYFGGWRTILAAEKRGLITVEVAKRDADGKATQWNLAVI